MPVSLSPISEGVGVDNLLRCNGYSSSHELYQIFRNLMYSLYQHKKTKALAYAYVNRSSIVHAQYKETLVSFSMPKKMFKEAFIKLGIRRLCKIT